MNDHTINNILNMYVDFLIVIIFIGILLFSVNCYKSDVHEHDLYMKNVIKRQISGMAPKPPVTIPFATMTSGDLIITCTEQVVTEGATGAKRTWSFTGTP